MPDEEAWVQEAQSRWKTRRQQGFASGIGIGWLLPFLVSQILGKDDIFRGHAADLRVFLLGGNETEHRSCWKDNSCDPVKWEDTPVGALTLSGDWSTLLVKNVTSIMCGALAMWFLCMFLFGVVQRTIMDQALNREAAQDNAKLAVRLLY